MKSVFAAAAVAASVLLAGPAFAQQDAVPSVVFDMGGKFDKSFNEAAYQGAERYKKESGIAYREFEVTERDPSASRRCATWRGAAPPWW